MASPRQRRSVRPTTNDLDGGDLRSHYTLAAATPSSTPTTPAQSLGDPDGPGDRPARDVGHQAATLASAMAPADDAPTPTGDVPSAAPTIIPTEHPASSPFPGISSTPSHGDTGYMAHASSTIS